MRRRVTRGVQAVLLGLALALGAGRAQGGGVAPVQVADPGGSATGKGG
jgi:hypothetical protein